MHLTDSLYGLPTAIKQCFPVYNHTYFDLVPLGYCHMHAPINGYRKILFSVTSIILVMVESAVDCHITLPFYFLQLDYCHMHAHCPLMVTESYYSLLLVLFLEWLGDFESVRHPIKQSMTIVS